MHAAVDVLVDTWPISRSTYRPIHQLSVSWDVCRLTISPYLASIVADTRLIRWVLIVGRISLTVGGISVDCRVILCTLGSFLKARAIKASSMGDRKCYEPNNPTMSTSIKTSQKNILCILLLKLFGYYPNLPCYFKERNFDWCWREVTTPDSRQRW